MRKEIVLLVAMFVATSQSAVTGQEAGADTPVEVRNKQIARAFYQDLWFSRNTDRYANYVAETYVVHDVGDRKGVTEPAVEQKNIADFFWQNGELSGQIDFQIAEGDLVATRWRARLEPSTFLGRFLMGEGDLPIINVFRIRDGKIVEIWNHRHDIDTGQNIRFKAQGFGFGFLFALIPIGYVIVLRRRLKIATEEPRSGTP